jgi:hypothetical protein
MSASAALTNEGNPIGTKAPTKLETFKFINKLSLCRTSMHVYFHWACRCVNDPEIPPVLECSLCLCCHSVPGLSDISYGTTLSQFPAFFFSYPLTLM